MTIEIGQLGIFTFPNESGLEAIGNNLLIETAGSGERIAVEDTTNRFKQVFLDTSNVKAVEELTKLIEGAVGDMVKVKNTSSAAILLGKIIIKNSVQVGGE